METIEERLERLEFHQKLLLKMISADNYAFYQLIICKQIKEKDVVGFYNLCEELSKELEEQKADDFVFFSPLFRRFEEELHPNLNPKEVIQACIKQKLYPELMQALEKNL